MEFNEKLQELRKRKGLTQEELAHRLYVSRTAVSKWESGRGYPNIESLKAIARFFSVTVDELLSSNEILELAELDGKQKQTRLRDLVYGLLDLSAAMLTFLPFFANRADGIIQEASLLTLTGVLPYLKIFYILIVCGLAITGILTLVLQDVQKTFWLKLKYILTFGFSVTAVLSFIMGLHPYAAVFVFILLTVKILMLIKR